MALPADFASQKGWEDTINLDDSEDMDILLQATRDEVLCWMKTYGRSTIREWLADNAKTLLAADGVIKKKGTRSSITAKSSSTQKPPYKRQKTGSKKLDASMEDSE